MALPNSFQEHRCPTYIPVFIVQGYEGSTYGFWIALAAGVLLLCGLLAALSNRQNEEDYEPISEKPAIN